ncbi:hypothetical protein KI387_015452, partial [Taxus chinensis]
CGDEGHHKNDYPKAQTSKPLFSLDGREKYCEICRMQLALKSQPTVPGVEMATEHGPKDDVRVSSLHYALKGVVVMWWAIHKRKNLERIEAKGMMSARFALPSKSTKAWPRFGTNSFHHRSPPWGCDCGQWEDLILIVGARVFLYDDSFLLHPATLRATTMVVVAMPVVEAYQYALRAEENLARQRNVVKARGNLVGGKEPTAHEQKSGERASTECFGVMEQQQWNSWLKNECGLYDHERFYFGDNVLPCFESGIPLLKHRLYQLPDSENISIAFPDEGSWKRFHKQLQHFPTVICTKVREGDQRFVRLKEGDPAGRHVVIVDDLVQSGSTLIECQSHRSILKMLTTGPNGPFSLSCLKTDMGQGALQPMLLALGSLSPCLALKDQGLVIDSQTT